MIREPLAPSAVAELLGAEATIIRAELSTLPAAVPTWHPAGGATAGTPQSCWPHEEDW